MSDLGDMAVAIRTPKFRAIGAKLVEIGRDMFEGLIEEEGFVAAIEWLRDLEKHKEIGVRAAAGARASSTGSASAHAAQNAAGEQRSAQPSPSPPYRLGSCATASGWSSPSGSSSTCHRALFILSEAEVLVSTG